MSAGLTTGGLGVTCPHCGLNHQTTCHRIRAIEYNENGTVKRIEFHAPVPVPDAFQWNETNWDRPREKT